MISAYKEEVVNIRLPSEEVIHCVYNYTMGGQPLIVVPPQFEKTVRTNLTPMLYLINNGFNVLRFDNRNHNGSSTGIIRDYSLGYVYEDLVEVVNFIRRSPGIESESGMGVLGISIASRVIYRYLALHPSVFDVFVSLVGVVDMGDTLKCILGFDIVEEYLNSPTRDFGTKKVLKYAIDYNNFLSDLVRMNLHTLESTQKDVDRIAAPTYLIVSEKDKWINNLEYEEVFKNNVDALVETFKLPGAGHKLYKNPQSAEVALEKIVEMFRAHWGMQRESYAIKKPLVTDVIGLNRQERERERSHGKEPSKS